MSAIVERPVAGDPTEQARTDDRMRAMLTGPNPGPVGERIVLLHFTGRRSGRRYTVPAGLHTLDGVLLVATGSGWRHNFAGGADGELTWRGERMAARFQLVIDEDRTACGYLELYRRYGAEAAERRLGIVARGDTPPQYAAFAAAVERCGLSLVEVAPLLPPLPAVADAPGSTNSRRHDTDERTP